MATILGAIRELSRSVQPRFKILKFGEGVRSIWSSSSLADPTYGCDTCQEVRGFPPSLWAKQVLRSLHDWTSSGLFLWALIHLECSENFFSYSRDLAKLLIKKSFVAALSQFLLHIACRLSD